MSDSHVVVKLDEDIVISTHSFDCMKNTISKAGFREGAIAGKEQNVQSGFDAGYKQGFNAGKSLGYLKGVHFATQALTLNGAALHPDENNIFRDARTILENSSKGVCQLCVDDNSIAQLEDETESINVESLQEIEKKQATALENALRVVHEAYKFPLIDSEKKEIS